MGSSIPLFQTAYDVSKTLVHQSFEIPFEILHSKQALNFEFRESSPVEHTSHLSSIPYFMLLGRHLDTLCGVA